LSDAAQRKEGARQWRSSRLGYSAVQLAKWNGAPVIAVASGTHEFCLRYLGADEFINYTESPAEDVARNLYQPPPCGRQTPPI